MRTLRRTGFAALAAAALTLTLPTSAQAFSAPGVWVTVQPFAENAVALAEFDPAAAEALTAEVFTTGSYGDFATASEIVDETSTQWFVSTNVLYAFDLITDEVVSQTVLSYSWNNTLSLTGMAYDDATETMWVTVHDFTDDYDLVGTLDLSTGVVSNTVSIQDIGWGASIQSIFFYDGQLYGVIDGIGCDGIRVATLDGETGAYDAPLAQFDGAGCYSYAADVNDDGVAVIVYDVNDTTRVAEFAAYNFAVTEPVDLVGDSFPTLAFWGESDGAVEPEPEPEGETVEELASTGVEFGALAGGAIALIAAAAVVARRRARN